MSLRVADAAAFDLAHLCGVGRCLLPAREVLRAVLQAAVRSRHPPPALPAGCALTGCDLAKGWHGGMSFC